MRRRSNRFKLLPAAVCGGYSERSYAPPPLIMKEPSIFDDPLFGDGTMQWTAPNPEQAEDRIKRPGSIHDWPREDLDFSMHTGSSTWHVWSALFRRDLLTEGALDVAEKCGAYWLMDIIGSVQHLPKLKTQGFQTWIVQVTHGPPPPKPWPGPGMELEECSDSWAMVICDNGNGRELYRQLVPMTDFPLAELKLYACDNERGGKTIMLPHEY